MTLRFAGRNVALIKSYNRRIVFDVIRRHGPSTKPAIASITGLTRTAVSKITDELVSMGFVRKVGLAESNGGRRAELFQVSGSSHFALAIDLSFHVPKFVIMSADGEILEDLGTRFENSFIDVNGLIRCIRQVLETIRVENKECVGIGVVVPGLFDTRSGTVLQAYALNWTDIPLKSLLQDAFELPVVVEKDTCAGLLAEEYYGGIKQVENSLYVSVGSGIGSAVMIGGRLYRGSSSMAGELGHMVINENGPVCRCGQRGCLEAYVCGHRLSEMAKQTSGKHFNGTLSTFIEKTENNYFDLCNVFESVEEGDTRAIRIVRKIGSFLAKCLANAIMLLNPETIFIGGEIYKGRRLLVEVIQEALPRYGLQTVVASASVVPASFDFRQGMMGVTAELLQAAVR